RFETNVREDLEVRKPLGASFPIQVAHHRTTLVAGTSIVYKVFRHRGTLYEREGILAWLYDWHLNGSFDLRVCVHPSLSREAVPAFLWEYAGRGLWRSGMFQTEADREDMEED